MTTAAPDQAKARRGSRTGTTTPTPATPSTTAATDPRRDGPPRLRRRPAIAAIGVALIAFGALGAAVLATAARSTIEVVAVASTVARGEQITAADLVPVAITPGQGLATVPAADLDALVGRWAQYDLPAGALVTPESVTEVPVPGPGQALVGLALSSGQLPSVELRSGDTVIVVGTPRQQDDPAELPPLATTTATVVSMTAADTAGGGTIMNVAVPVSSAEELAARAATGRIAVILAGPGRG
jgi:hypothetical protein